MATIGVPTAPVSPLYHRGEYDPATRYAKNDAVSYLGSSYINVYPLGSTGVAPLPGENTATWKYLAIKGDPGDTGPAGPQGQPGPAGPQGEPGPTVALLRATTTATITAAAPGVENTVSAAFAPTYALLAVTTDAPARVRVYTNHAAADADRDRPVTDDPTPSSGLVMEYVTTSTIAESVAPAILADGTLGPAITVASNAATTADLTVQLTYLALEAAA